MQIDSQELTEYIKGVITAIESATQNNNHYLSGNVEFDLAVVTTKKGEGSLKLFVVNAGGEIEKEAISRVKFQIAKDTFAGVSSSDVISER